jgi:tRNA A37 threonylcarbamoyladenosine modification protein TsaB
MDRNWQVGDWLLVDAAGPVMVTAVLRDGAWLQRETYRDGFIESLKPGVENLLATTGLTTAGLAGVLYACGPGSTLGLRLAAMFLRSLMQHPALAHWKCFSYNNLELACADRIDPSNPAGCRAFAPWRRDRLHEVCFTPGPPPEFTLSSADPAEVIPNSGSMVALGNRSANLPANFQTIPYPLERIPEILDEWPMLVTPMDQPELYSAETPVFAKWSSTRHSGK